MSNLLLWSLPPFFLLGAFVLTAFSSAMRRVYKQASKKELSDYNRFHFYKPFHLALLPGQEYESIFFATLASLNVCRYFFVFSLSAIIFIEFNWFYDNPWMGSAIVVGLLLFIFAFSDYLPRILGSLYPANCFKYFAPIASIYLFLSFPFTYLFIKILNALFKNVTLDHLHEPLAEAKQEIFDIIQESDMGEKLEPDDKKMIESVVNFRDLIVREVMMPRVDIFSLPSDISVREAAKKLEEEGYSRTPIYKGTIDQIIGILMYKDVLAKYMESSDKNDLRILDQPVEVIVKPVIYTPETKKISHLLQEFRKKQMHLAVVVDEYGGTEGIVTIEDILEELVGDIEDEYDDEKDLFVVLADGSYIVDARMGILDLEQQLGFVLPEEGDFDTLGGYIFHVAGEIPVRGFTIRQDEFDLEVLRANERSIEKVKLRPKPTE